MLTDWLAVLQPEGHLRVLTDSLRAKHAVEWRDGVVEDRRYEYFRGKDFAMYFKQHPEKFSSWIPDKSGALMPPDVMVNVVYVSACHVAVTLWLSGAC